MTRPGRRSRWLLACGALAVLPAASPTYAAGPISAKRAEAQRVYAEAQGLAESLSRADEQVNLADVRLAEVEAQRHENRLELAVAKANLARGRQAIARMLVTLYTTPQPSLPEVILGARSLDDVITRLDAEKRVAALDTSIVGQVETFRTAVVRHGRELARERVTVRRLIAEREAARASITTQLAERRRLLASIQGDIARLEAEAQARQLRIAREAQARIAAAAQAQRQAVEATVVGATVETPAGLTAVPPSSYGGRAVAIAMAYLGTPYVWGGSAPGGFDCSGLVMYAYAQLGISLPHSSYAMWSYGVPVAESELEPGDIVFFDGLGHVGMYVGGNAFIDAPFTGAVVRIDSLADPWAVAHYSGARRIL